MNILIFGMPGSGKGTVSKKIMELFELCHISQGDILRKEMSNNLELMNKIKTLGYVPNEISFPLILRELDKCNKGFLLDGFPRSIKQNEYLENYLIKKNKTIDVVIYLEVTKDMSMDRILKRNRVDDKELNIENRIKKFYEYTYPVIKHYKNKNYFYKIDGSRSEEKVWEDIVKIF